MQHQVDALAVIEDVLVIAHLQPVTVDRERLIIHRIGGEERHDFLRVLVWADVVRAARDGHGQPPRFVIGQHHQIAAGLAGGVRAARLEVIRLRGAIFQDLPVNLVGADLVIALQSDTSWPPQATRRCRRRRSG